MEKIEIMAPVGSYESLEAAIKAGADSIYFGVQQLNMRAKSSDNFNIGDLIKIVLICKKHNIKSYLALNTIVYDHDLLLMRNICDAAKLAGITAVICSDMAAISYARSINLEVHASTQLNVSNLEAVKFFSRYCDVIVLARELTLKQIEDICKKIKKEKIKGASGKLLKIEIFVHGALCVAISGKCYMSLATQNSSANRGACLQPCRRKYKVTDEETGDELIVDNQYIMSPKDLCTISFLDKLVKSGVSVFKIEGRGRSADYVYTVVSVYRQALKAVKNKSYTKEKIRAWIKSLSEVYNRGFWQGGYYLGKKLGEWSGTYGSHATMEKTLVGRVTHFFDKKKITEVLLTDHPMKKGDKIIITGEKTGIVYHTISNMWFNGKPIKKAEKTSLITLKIKEKVRENDKVFVINKRQRKNKQVDGKNPISKR